MPEDQLIESHNIKYKVVTADEFYNIIKKNNTARNLIISDYVYLSKDLELVSSLDFSNCIFQSEFIADDIHENNNLVFSLCTFKQRVLILNCKFSMLSFYKCTFDQYFITKKLIAKTYKIEDCIINNSKELRIEDFKSKNLIFD